MDGLSNICDMVDLSVKIQLKHIQSDIEWLIQVINARFKNYFGNGQEIFNLHDFPPPDFDEKSVYSEMITNLRLKPEERLILVLALIPHIQPQIFDIFFTKNNQFDRGHTEFGGIKGNYFGGFIPTGETAMFILAANDLYKRQQYMQLFDEDSTFAREHILWLDNPHTSEPFMSGVLTLSEDIVDIFCSGKLRKPKFNIDFPAKRITTQMDWNDLVLENDIKEQINEIKAWIKHGDTLLYDWGFEKRIKPGYKSLFFGPSGTGKTLAATLIGKETAKDVYRIDLSMIVSKYIGETEKNLSKIFNKATNKDWILFFDEADALFGKRTNVSDAHDRYANQEVSFLLQKIEDHPGLVILASNMKSNIDEAFTRRFQSMIHFPMPKAAERYQLWQKAFSAKSVLDPDIDLRQIAGKYELTGGSIVNISRYASLMALYNNTNRISSKWFFAGIKKEFLKEGKTI